MSDDLIKRGDLIRRSDAIEAIEETDWWHQNRYGTMVSGANSAEHQAWYKAEDIYKALEAIPTADRPQEWIPCSERLPSEKEWTDSYIRNKKASEFFVMIKGADRPTTLYLSRDHYWFDENRDFYEVVAWMPMPEPYTEGANNETD